MGSDDDIELGLSPVNNFQPVHQFRDVTKMITVAPDAEEQPKATETQTPTDSQARVGEVVPTGPLQPNGQDTTVTAEVTGEDTRTPAVEQESAEPSAQVAVGETGVSETRESETTAQDTAQGAPADSGYEIERPVVNIQLAVTDEQKSEIQRLIDGFKYIQGADNMGDEEWSAAEVAPAPVQPVETKARASMPVEFGTFRERYKALEDGHATREAEILKKMREREELLVQMGAKLDQENASLAAFKTDRLA